MIGSKLAHYDITSHLGTGGMGEVYEATDSKLGRSVAIKCLPEAFANDNERVTRFQREARVLASLNHSNIAAIYGLEETAGRHFLVMEYVPGETLAMRISRGPLPVEDALGIALQIAEALEGAHDKGILHRDLKPANIKITHSGKVKVLDFGLAKILGDEPANPTLSNSPTMLSQASIPGVILGTAAYMSPEQSRGKPVDKRTDIWAFGIVMFEMLVGRRVFDGETVTDVIGAIAHKEPPWESLPATTPAPIHRLLRRCLAKDPRRRLHDIADVRLEIEAASTEPLIPFKAAPGVSKRALVAAGILAITIAALALFAGRWMNIRTPDAAILWTEILPPFKSFGDFPAPALSPDGRLVAFNALDAAGKTVLWVRPIDSPEARALPGTEGSFESFWSPDSHSLAFCANGKLMRVEVAGGNPQFLADAPFFEGGSWAADGTILFVPSATTVYRISASGGAPTPVTRLNAARHELIHGWPSFLPDGKHFLVWVFSSEKQNEGIHIGTIDSGELRPLLPIRSRAQYANGYLFFGRQRNLLAQTFDPDALQLSGEPKRVAAGIGFSFGEMANFAFSVSEGGGIAWSDRNPFPGTRPTWFDRTGNVVGKIGDPSSYFGLMPSPDGRYVATEFTDLLAQTVDILAFDTSGGNQTRLTFVNYWAGNPVWSPDSRRVLYTQWRDYFNVISIQGGNGEQTPFLGGTNSDFPLSWAADNQNLLVQRGMPSTLLDLWIQPMSGERKLRPYLNTPVNEFGGRVSPDGDWVAYTSDESGRNEVFVQSFPAPGNKKRISVAGGYSPMWRKDGRELYFISQDRILMAVSVTAKGDSIDFSAPARLFMQKNLYADVAVSGRGQYAPSLDGQRFLVLVPVETDKLEGLHFIHNWKP